MKIRVETLMWKERLFLLEQFKVHAATYGGNGGAEGHYWLLNLNHFHMLSQLPTRLRRIRFLEKGLYCSHERG